MPTPGDHFKRHIPIFMVCVTSWSSSCTLCGKNHLACDLEIFLAITAKNLCFEFEV